MTSKPRCRQGAKNSAAIRHLEARVNSCLTSFHTLFVTPDGGTLTIRPCEKAHALEFYHQSLVALRRELRENAEDPSGPTPCRYKELACSSTTLPEPDAIDHYNQFYDFAGEGMEVFLQDAILQALFDFGEFSALDAEVLRQSESAANLVRHARIIYDHPLPSLMREYREVMDPGSVELGRFRGFGAPDKALAKPWAQDDWLTPSFFSFLKLQFAKFGILEYVNGNLIVSEVKPVKPPDAFYGYDFARKALQKYFDTFAAGTRVAPLILDGPPGMGKTELILSYAHEKRLQIVIAYPDDLNNHLAELLHKLGRSSRKSLLFFDDLDPTRIDWHAFRQAVGGTARYPANVAIALVTNERFPTNVYSRGCYVEIPPFSFDVCQSIVAGYLKARGEENPRRINQVGAGYLLAFGQAEIDEISPRSLIFYLDGVWSGRMKILAAPTQRMDSLLFREVHDKHRARVQERSGQEAPG